MLQITIEIWPGGDKTRARVLATSSVANLSDLADVSDYAVRVSEGYNHITNSAPYSLCGKIFQHDRKSSVWALVAKIATLATEEAAKAGR
ncbi:hypothetical protein [Afipia felis]|uniref:Uncharacterized protein n=2 Tax=Afipia felis TaxID=1035 RepID=A0A380W4S6_AFIFE|nr:hypothetical protein [Afipia felis]EKS31111.1 hypothetical protein HMPREF9697_03639 [Afipia felis ATCC 53690]SUU75855.1 Uncharacterised protein [Afipia felis]SUU83922.1 Uncharacterised protein [Afipia felis]